MIQQIRFDLKKIRIEVYRNETIIRVIIMDDTEPRGMVELYLDPQELQNLINYLQLFLDKRPSTV